MGFAEGYHGVGEWGYIWKLQYKIRSHSADDRSLFMFIMSRFITSKLVTRTIIYRVLYIHPVHYTVASATLLFSEITDHNQMAKSKL